VRTQPHVLLDATAIPAERGGVGRYVDGLAAGLDQEGAALTVICRGHDTEVFTGLAPHSRILPAPHRLANRAARLTWEQTTLPGLARRLGADVLHSPHYTMPLAGGTPSVVTLHDATFFSDRHLHLGVKGRFFRAWTRTSLRRAATCIVPSRATADALVRHAKARRDRLAVAHHGVDATVFHPPTAAEVADRRRRLGLGGRPFIAFLGTLEPRKNVPVLIRAFGDAVLDHPAPPALVLAGGQGWDPEVDAALAAVPDRLRVIRAGRLPSDLLAALLGGALLVAYPSLGEGFGLPVLEGMACGAAVLTTRRLALPEVGGDAVAYTDPDRRSVAAALADLLADAGRRRDLGAAGLARSAQFTWRASARAHMRAYERAVAAAVAA
jgi:glycosyltransferase involved in cell wall biosynthesis